MRHELATFFHQVIIYTEEHGNEIQKGDAPGLIAQITRNINGLEDFETGIKDSKKHPHHPPDLLRKNIYQGNRVLRRFIRGMQF